MKVEGRSIPEVVLVTPTMRGDARGAWHESWQQSRQPEAALPAHGVHGTAG